MRRGKRELKNETTIKGTDSGGKNKKSKKAISKALIIIAIIIVIFVIGLLVNEFVVFDNNKTTNLVINNKNVTSNLKQQILIEDNIIYLSESDIANFFDKYIYEEKETNQIITTYEKKIAAIGFEDNKITINGSDKNIYAHAIKKDGIVYLPISEMKDVYDIEISNIEKTKVITMDSLEKEQKKAIVTSDTSVKSSTNFISKTVDRIKRGECVVVISSNNGYTKIRTENGKIGYIKSNQLENEFIVRESMEEEKQINGKVNLT